MIDFCDEIKGKKITLMGLGLLGRGLGDAKFLAECGAILTVTDLKTEKELEKSVKQLKQYKNIKFVLGAHKMEDFSNADLIIKGNGVPLKNKYIEKAVQKNIEITMSTALFAKYAIQKDVKLVGVTGTKGKSSVTHMIYESLKKLNQKTNVWLGGNIRGLSTLALLSEVKNGDIVILELDSWQLQGFGYEKISPEIAVFTNFFPDHMSYYPSLESYFQDKANIFKYQKINEKVFCGVDVFGKIKEENQSSQTIKTEKLPNNFELKAKGDFNIQNASLARMVLKELGCQENKIKRALESFKGVEGRLEYMGNFNGIEIYNDNNATVAEATIQALKSFDKKVILIAGGTDKGFDLQKVAKEINQKTKKVFLLEGTGTEKILSLLNDYQVFDNFSDTVMKALRFGEKGDVILFSPIFSSFGKEFNNEYERNDKFKKIVKEFFDKPDFIA